MISRGFRNNNPGNLIITNSNWIGKVPRSQNTDGRFEQFTSMFWGIRAMLIDIIGDIVKDGLDTLNKLIPEYAPSFENNTQAYIKRVSQATGLQPNQNIPLDKEMLRKLIKAKIEVENGVEATKTYYREIDFDRAFRELPVSTLALIQVKNKGPVLLVVLSIVLSVLLAYKYLNK